MHWEARLRRLATNQAGVIGIHQMGTVGGDHRWWTNARRNRRWEPLSDHVLRLDGWPTSAEQQAFAGVLDAGPAGFLHGEPALAWYGARNRSLVPVAVGRKRGTSNHPVSLATVHRLRAVRPGDIVVVRGLPVLSPLRAVWEDAARHAHQPLEWSVPRVGRALDDLHRERLVRWDELHASIDELAKRGRAGTTIMRELAKGREPGSSATESRLEDRCAAVLADGGARPLKPQVVVGADRPIGRTDFRDEDLPMVAEVNSLTFHSTPSDRDADRRRYGRLLAARFSIAVIWEDDLWSNTADVLRVVDAARRSARRGRPALFHTASCPWPEDCRDPL